ncbi:hypothetical protein RE943_11850 [Prescottella equi]|nr:hypothetical protein RE943_11850 [Prescottella equi]
MTTKITVKPATTPDTAYIRRSTEVSLNCTYRRELYSRGFRAPRQAGTASRCSSGVSGTATFPFVGIQPPEDSSRSKRGVYGISVTSELSGIGPQTLRLYESRGLITPSRTSGGTRRYSEDDLYRLTRISELVALGVNLTGIGLILSLEDERAALTAENARLRAAAESAV